MTETETAIAARQIRGRHLSHHLLGVLHLLRRAGDRARWPGGRISRPIAITPIPRVPFASRASAARRASPMAPTACSIPCAGSARAAKASGRVSPGTRRWTRWPTGWRPGAPEVRRGRDRRRYQRRLLQPQRHPGADSRSIGSPNWMINQDLCGGCRAVSARAMGLNIYARRGHRQHPLRARSSAATRASPIPSSGQRSRPPRSAALVSSSSIPSARRPRRWPICGSPRASAPMPRSRSL